MYCFQDGSQVISIKREATDTQQDQQNSAVALSFPAKKDEGGWVVFFISIGIHFFKHVGLSEHFSFVLYTLVY